MKNYVKRVVFPKTRIRYSCKRINNSDEKNATKQGKKPVSEVNMRDTKEISILTMFFIHVYYEKNKNNKTPTSSFQ